MNSLSTLFISVLTGHGSIIFQYCHFYNSHSFPGCFKVSADVLHFFPMFVSYVSQKHKKVYITDYA